MQTSEQQDKVADQEPRARKIQDGHLMIYHDPHRPGGGFWRHSCESEEQCGNYIEP